MMRRLMTLLALAAVPAFAQAPAKAPAKTPEKTQSKAAPAKAPAKEEESEAQLAKEAKITEAAARATALASVPGGKVKAHELEKEDGKLIYTFDIEVAGKPGIEEVHVDAITGKMIKMEHESPAKEKSEADADKAKGAKAPAKAPPKKP